MKRIKKTAKFSLLACFALMLYGIATSSGSGWLYVISASLAGVLGVSILFTLTSARGIEARRHSPPVGTAGAPLSCVLEIRNTGRFSKTLMEIEDGFAGGVGRAVVERVKPGVPERVEYTIENPRRGVYSDGDTRIESAAPFGLLTSRRLLRAASATTIYPKTFEVAGLPRPTLSEAAESGKDEAAAPHRGAGGDFWGVREYRPGDPARLIAWRQSARSASAGRLAVMEMAREADPPLSVALDLDAEAPSAAIEMVVSAAASLLLRALREGRGAVADAGPQSKPFPESLDRDAILGWCAALGTAANRESPVANRKTTTRGWRFRDSHLSRLPAPDSAPQFREPEDGKSRRSGEAPVESGDNSSSGEATVSGQRKSGTPRLTTREASASELLTTSPERSHQSEATPTVEIIPSLARIRATDCRADTVILVSCHEFAGAGPWMSPEEEREFIDKIEAAGRRAARLGPDVSEPWGIS